jgi:putative oxidoreductase
VGLALMRVVAAAYLIQPAVAKLRSVPPGESTPLIAIKAAAAILVLVGLWTPIVGTVVTALELWSAASCAGDPWVHILAGTLSGALALLGPGAWSVDGRLFGRKRIDIHDRNQA